jgi:hypothetical protein
MEVLSGERNARARSPGSNLRDIPREVVLIDLLIRIFLLTREERFRAGIFIGYEGREWINREALILPPAGEEKVSPVYELYFHP